MSKKLVKRLSLLLTLLLTMTFLTPLMALAQETPAIAVVAVERFTIGQGFYKEPSMVGLEAGDTAYDLLVNLVGKDNILMDGRDLKAIKGADGGAGALTIPDYIVKTLAGPNSQAAKNHANPLSEKALGKASYSDQAKWVCVVNNKVLDEKIRDYRVKDKDVIRFAFSYWGHGSDVTGYQAGVNKPLVTMDDKDKLVGAMAFVNVEIYPYLFASPVVKNAYHQALAVMAKALASQSEIDKAKDALLEAADGYDLVAQYKTHIQNEGWEDDWMFDNEMSGTSGRSLRLEGIKIDLLDNKDYAVGLAYKTHIENKGWEDDWKKDGVLSGTHGLGLRLEAIEIKLTGPDAHLFDVFYQVHAQNVGWMDLAKNGSPAGTAGFAYRLEGIRIQVVPRGLQPRRLSKPSVDDSFIEK